ncbi:hypothetical protein [Halorientalis halophila]|uniref:hypothetical protein n=1 Tax=Halorientalis halophila TaxID=3108499 RepID=UPI00300841F8
MPTDTRGSDGATHRTGPTRASFEQYRYVTTEHGGIVYHVDRPAEWIEATRILDLDDCR